MPSPQSENRPIRMSEEYKVVNSNRIKSLFGDDTTANQFIPFPGVNNANPGIGRNGIPTNAIGPSDIHRDDTNDVSIDSIVSYTSGIPSMRLTYADFAYLKNIGVYPNNRLIVARRFTNGVDSDLSSVSVSPISTLVSWVPEDQDWLTIDWGEEWTDAEGNFTTILNNLGGDIAPIIGGSKLGDFVSSGLNMLPFPGFTEGLQYDMMRKLGITDDFGVGNSPSGNPNIIRKAKQRSTIDRGVAGSGLSCNISISMVVEYEQKYISGLDPTLVYLDIIQNAITFGTSEAVFEFNSKYAEDTKGFIKDLISGDFKSITKSIIAFVTALVDIIKDKVSVIIEHLGNPAKIVQDLSPEKVLGAIEKAFSSTVGHVVSKYRVKLLGVINALTGSPSAPWHVTIGNPKKPIFCSGDMLTTSVKVELGKTLAFNDLPSYIKISFTLANARPIGAQEIFQRFNTGRGRTYARIKESYVEKTIGLTWSKINMGTQSKTITKTDGTTGTASYQSFKTTVDVTDTGISGVPDDSKFYEGVVTGTWFGGDANLPSDVTIGDPVTNPTVPNTSQVQPSLSSVSTIPGSTVNLPNSTGAGPQTVGNQSVNQSSVPGYIGGSWMGGQLLNQGSLNQEGVRISWSVSSALQENTYIGRWDTSGGGNSQTSDTDYGVILAYAKQEAESEFNLALQSKGLTKI